MEEVTITDEPHAVRITITGRVFDNLAKIAATLNGVSWLDRDNTPATLADYWIGDFLRRLAFACLCAR